MQLKVVIQAHPSRTEMAEALAQHVWGTVVWDPDPGAAVSSPWRTFRACLEAPRERVTHLCVIQDDATPVTGFNIAVRTAVEARPDRLIALYVGGGRYIHRRALHEAGHNGDDWATLPSNFYFPVVGSVWPVEMIEPFLAFVDEQNWPEKFCSDDEIVGQWLRASGQCGIATVPCLVEHEDMVPAVRGRRAMHGEDPARSTCCAPPEGCDVTLSDWQQGPC